MPELIISGFGEFSHFKLVIPAQAGIQKCFAEKAGCPPPSSQGQAPRGHDGKNSPTPQLFNPSIYLNVTCRKKNADLI
jgi:hypothetical protein